MPPQAPVAEAPRPGRGRAPGTRLLGPMPEWFGRAEMWLQIRRLGEFTIRDLAERPTVDSHPREVRKYVRALRRAGHVRRTGTVRERLGTTGTVRTAPVYRLVGDHGPEAGGGRHAPESEPPPRVRTAVAVTVPRGLRAVRALLAAAAVGAWAGLFATWAAAGPAGRAAAAGMTLLVWSPWLPAAALGIRAWLAGRARGPDRLAHACAVLAAAAVPGILLAAIGIGSAPPSGPAMGCGLLDAVCAGLVGSHVALAAANLTLGLAFPALLPAAAAAASAALLPRGRPANLPHVAFAVFNTAVLWAIASVLGFALANA